MLSLSPSPNRLAGPALACRSPSSRPLASVSSSSHRTASSAPLAPSFLPMSLISSPDAVNEHNEHKRKATEEFKESQEDTHPYKKRATTEASLSSSASVSSSLLSTTAASSGHMCASSSSVTTSATSATSATAVPASSQTSSNLIVDASMQEFQCCICHNLIYQFVSLDCNHSFCKNCIQEWFKTSMTCPVDRSLQSGKVNAVRSVDCIISKLVDHHLSQEERVAYQKNAANIDAKDKAKTEALSSSVPHAPPGCGQVGCNHDDNDEYEDDNDEYDEEEEEEDDEEEEENVGNGPRVNDELPAHPSRFLEGDVDAPLSFRNRIGFIRADAVHHWSIDIGLETRCDLCFDPIGGSVMKIYRLFKGLVNRCYHFQCATNDETGRFPRFSINDFLNFKYLPPEAQQVVQLALESHSIDHNQPQEEEKELDLTDADLDAIDNTVNSTRAPLITYEQCLKVYSTSLLSDRRLLHRKDLNTLFLYYSRESSAQSAIMSRYDVCRWLKRHATRIRIAGTQDVILNHFFPDD